MLLANLMRTTLRSIHTGPPGLGTEEHGITEPTGLARENFNLTGANNIAHMGKI